MKNKLMWFVIRAHSLFTAILSVYAIVNDVLLFILDVITSILAVLQSSDPTKFSDPFWTLTSYVKRKTCNAKIGAKW